jgi:hypothetical protein
MTSPDSLTWIAHEARQLRTSSALRGRAWSLAQVCEHLALAIQRTVDAPAPVDAALLPKFYWVHIGPARRLQRRLIKHVMFWSGRIPAGVPAPDFAQPSPSTDLDSAIQLLDSTAHAFDRKHARADATWNDHPLLGPMTGAEWRRFHEVHAQHHFRFMKPTSVH